MKGIKIIELLWVIISAPVWLPAVVVILLTAAFLYIWYYCWFELTCTDCMALVEREITRAERAERKREIKENKQREVA